jgi:hypothetical protein
MSAIAGIWILAKHQFELRVIQKQLTLSRAAMRVNSVYVEL